MYLPQPKKPSAIFDNFLKFIEEKELQEEPILTNIMTFKTEASKNKDNEIEIFSELIDAFSREPLKSLLEKDCLKNSSLMYF